jgi:hypothetical protein
VTDDFYGAIPKIEDWLIAKCDTISDKKLNEEEQNAFAMGQLDRFITARDRRTSCIQESLLEERLTRRREVGLLAATIEQEAGRPTPKAPAKSAAKPWRNENDPIVGPAPPPAR